MKNRLRNKLRLVASELTCLVLAILIGYGCACGEVECPKACGYRFNQVLLIVIPGNPARAMIDTPKADGCVGPWCIPNSLNCNQISVTVFFEYPFS